MERKHATESVSIKCCLTMGCVCLPRHIVSTYLFLVHDQDSVSASLDVGKTAGVWNGVLGRGVGGVHPILVLLDAAAVELEARKV